MRQGKDKSGHHFMHKLIALIDHLTLAIDQFNLENWPLHAEPSFIAGRRRNPGLAGRQPSIVGATPQRDAHAQCSHE